MACNEHIAEIQSEAELFLIKVLQSCHGSTTESTAHKIAQLAHTENAASALFRASNFGGMWPTRGVMMLRRRNVDIFFSKPACHISDRKAQDTSEWSVDRIRI